MDLKKFLSIDELESLPAEVPIDLISESSEDESDKEKEKNYTISGWDYQKAQAHLASYFLKLQSDNDIEYSTSKILELACVGNEMRNREDLIIGSGAIKNDEYDSIPDDADQKIYSLLEAAYVSMFDNVDQRYAQRSEVNHRRRKLNRLNKKLWMMDLENMGESIIHPGTITMGEKSDVAVVPVKGIGCFKYHMHDLLKGREDAWMGVMERRAKSDIQQYKNFLLQERTKKLERLRNCCMKNIILSNGSEEDLRRFEFFTLRQKTDALWKINVANMNPDQINVSTYAPNFKGLHDEFRKVAKEIAISCTRKVKDKIRKNFRRSSSKEIVLRGKRFGREIFQYCRKREIEISLAEQEKRRIAAELERQKLLEEQRENIVKEQRNMRAFIVAEIQIFCELLFNKQKPIEEEEALECIDANYQLQFARISASRLFEDRLEELNAFDGEWKRCCKLSKIHDTPEFETDQGAIDEKLVKEKAKQIKNPFSADGFPASKWEWLELDNPIPHKSSLISGIRETEQQKKQGMLVKPLNASDSVSKAFEKMLYLTEKGLNSVVLGSTHERRRHQIIALLASIAGEQNSWGPHLIVAPSNQVLQWEESFQSMCTDIRIMPYYGSVEDRQELRKYWDPKKLYTVGSLFHVVLTDFQTLYDDFDNFHLLLWQVIVFDSALPVMLPGGTMKYWLNMLGIRCRHRMILLDSFRTGNMKSNVDLRVLLHFLMPVIFQNLRKVLVWSAAALSDEQLRELISVLKCFVVTEDNEKLETEMNFLISDAENSFKAEAAVLEVLEKEIAQLQVAPAVVEPESKPLTVVPDAQEIDGEKAFICRYCDKTFTKAGGLKQHIKGEHASLGTWLCRHCNADCFTLGGRVVHEKLHADDDGDVTRPERPAGFTCMEPSIEQITVNGNAAPEMVAAPKQEPRAPGTTSRRTPARAKKRITRCGRCAGCNAADCMKCGHCRDMKKYGGPGLRKQSCKNRKCIDPQVVILNTTKEERHAGSAGNDTPQVEAPHLESPQRPTDKRKPLGLKKVLVQRREDELDISMKIQYDQNELIEESPIQDLRDLVMDMGSGSEHEPKKRKKKDKHNSFPVSAIAAPSTPISESGGTPMLIASPSSTSRQNCSRAARTRVMRCGKCVGCLAPDCLKCRHCLDMKKYGGPGLRKQSCKSRKCVTPKVVVLNAPKPEGEEDGDGDDRGSLRDENTDMNRFGVKSFGRVDKVKRPKVKRSISGNMQPHLSYLDAQVSRSHMTKPVQARANELSLLLPYHCSRCSSRFAKIEQVRVHTELRHPEGASKLQLQILHSKNLQTIASLQATDALIQDPAVQYVILRGMQDHLSPTGSLRDAYGYAKLEGPGMVHFMMHPKMILGRISRRWRSIYAQYGVDLIPGLPGGSVDCHLGDDMRISHRHAEISWNTFTHSFEIQCLSLLSSITVNGHRLDFSSSPIKLKSKSLVQIGARCFFFLLPLAPTSTNQIMPIHSLKVLPTAEIRAWANSAFLRHTAKQRIKRELETEIELKMLKKRRNGLFT